MLSVNALAAPNDARSAGRRGASAGNVGETERTLRWNENVERGHYGGRISAPLLLWKYNEHNAGGKRALGGRGRRERRAGIKKERKKGANGTRR